MTGPALDEIGLRALRLFATIYRTRNLSRAADEMATSQPSVSASLDRLRRLFDDPLFVRVGAQMQPTPRADMLIDGVRAIFAIADDHFTARAPFDPPTSTRRFTIHMTDPAETILLPRLVRHLATSAPGVRLHVREVGDDSQAMLADGRVDLIVGFIAREREQLAQCKLHDEHFVGIARIGHPRTGSLPTLTGWRAEGQVAIGSRRDGQGSVAIEVSSYFAAAAIVAQTDLVAVVPARLGEHLAAAGGIVTFVPPVAPPPFAVRQYWHPRFHHDGGNQWLRAVMVDLVGR